MESSSAAAFDEQQNSLISSFLEIAICQTPETAKQFLQATGWKLEEALQLFYVGNDGGEVASTSSLSAGNINSQIDQTVCGSKGEYDKENVGQHYEDEVRPPLPVKREALYEDAMLYASSREGYPANESSSLIAFRNFTEEMKHPGVWESEQISASKPESSRDNLASLYRPPFHLMFHGSFDKAKASASAQDKWLIVNLQSTKEFSSHMLNRDTWANEAVSQTISTNFIFWQVYEDTTEGRKVCTYYKLDSIPVVLVIDPITGQKMRAWSGMIQPESLLEDLLPYLDGGPRNHHATLSHKRPRESSVASHTTKVIVEETKRVNTKEALPASDEGTPSVAVSKNLDSSDSERAETCLINHPAYPQLPEEPEVDRNLICRVGVRLPDGRRVQRNFLRADPIQLLWSFCYSQLEEAKTRSFRLAHAIPGASKFIDYDEKLTFEESGLANSMISVTWV